MHFLSLALVKVGKKGNAGNCSKPQRLPVLLPEICHIASQVTAIGSDKFFYTGSSVNFGLLKNLPGLTSRLLSFMKKLATFIFLIFNAFVVFAQPASVDIAPDSLEICLGDSIQLTATTSTGGTGLAWSPSDSLFQISPDTVVVFPSQSTWYFASLTVGGTTVTDSVFVRVDSLPDMTIIAIPEKDIYCQGEIVSLISNNMQEYPDAVYQWSPLTGVTSEDTLLNLVLTATVSTTYIRVSSNHACSSIDSIFIPVAPVATITVTPANSVVCPGTSVPLSASADQPVDSWEWSPAVGLSCTDCTDPVATPPATITYLVTADFMGCPNFATAVIQVIADPNYQFPNPPVVCEGEGIVLNQINDPNATFEWTLPDGTVFSTAAQPEVFPTTTTTYGLTARVGNCDPITDQVTVSVANDFTMTASADTVICAGQAYVLNATASDPNVVFAWTDETGAQVGTGPSLSITINDESTYTVTGSLSSQTSLCFTHSESITVGVHPNFNLTVSPDQTITAGDEVAISAEADLAGVTFEWTKKGMAGVISTEDMLEETLCSDAVYYVTATDPQGCYPKTDSVTITVNAGFGIDSIRVLQQDETVEIYEGEELEINILTNPVFVAGLSYEWYFDSTLVATTTDTVSGIVNAPEIIDPAIECLNMTVRAVAIGEGGCSVSIETVIEVCNNPVEVPNVFSPNNDSTNDFFKPVSPVPVNILEFKVWDRWGKLVYNNEGGNDGWNGRKGEDEALSDVYVYLLKWEIIGGGAVQYVEKGDVTLLR
jgi:gliding motility-associated-like protein